MSMRPLLRSTISVPAAAERMRTSPGARSSALCPTAPGGYEWQPKKGEDVLVVRGGLHLALFPAAEHRQLAALDRHRSVLRRGHVLHLMLAQLSR